jgi:hypothetical protein
MRSMGRSRSGQVARCDLDTALGNDKVHYHSRIWCQCQWVPSVRSGSRYLGPLKDKEVPRISGRSTADLERTAWCTQDRHSHLNTASGSESSEDRSKRPLVGSPACKQHHRHRRQDMSARSQADKQHRKYSLDRTARSSRLGSAGLCQSVGATLPSACETRQPCALKPCA